MIALVDLANKLLAVLLLQIDHINLAVCLVLNEVESDDFVYQVYSQPPILLQCIKEKERQQSSPQTVGEGTNQLYSELPGIPCVEKASLLVENARSDNCPDAAEAVDFADVQGVVNFEAGDQALGLVVDGTSNDSDAGSCPQLNVIA